MYHYICHTGECLQNASLFCCCCCSEGTPGGSNPCILCCSDPFLLGTRWPWAAEKLQTPVRNRETPRKPEEKEVSDQIKFSYSVGESENSKRRILSPQGGNGVCVLVKGQLVASAAWSMQGSCGIVWMAPLAFPPCAWSWLVPVLLLAIFGPYDDHDLLWCHPLSPVTGKWVIVFSHSPLLISLLAFPLRAIPHKTSPSVSKTTLPSVGVWVEGE